jgi:hypothetical protein
MNENMSVRKAFLFGALIGDGLALAFLLNYRIRPFPMAVHDWLDGALIEACPFYSLGFSNLVHGWASLITTALVGNAILYGAAGVICFLLYRGILRAAGAVLGSSGRS